MRRLLINRTDIAEWKNISKTVNDEVLNPFIFDAQFIDLQKLMGSQFFNDLERNYDNVVYQSLLNAGDYTHLSVIYYNAGIKRVLVDYAYSRYVLLGSNRDTPFGLVVKQTQDSQPSSIEDKKTMHKMNQQSAFNYWESVVDFINRNETDYPLWNDAECVVKRGSFRISRIG